MSFKKMKLPREMKWGVALLGGYLLWALIWLVSHGVSYRPSADMAQELLSPFSENFILGTDIYGRSLFEILSTGLSYSLGMGLTVSFLSLSIGVGVGYLSITGPRFIRVSMDLLTNLIFVFPSILIAILVMSVVGQSFAGLVFALVVTGWPGYARIVRGETQRVMGLTYIESAKAIGMPSLRLFWKCVLPAILPVMVVHLVLGVSGVIVSEAALGFLGLGGSEYSWGAMLSMAKTVLLEAPFIVFIVSLCMAGLIIGLNLFGDGLRDYLDPRKD